MALPNRKRGIRSCVGYKPANHPHQGCMDNALVRLLRRALGLRPRALCSNRTRALYTVALECKVPFPGLNGWLRAPGSIITGSLLDCNGLQASDSIKMGFGLQVPGSIRLVSEGPKLKLWHQIKRPLPQSLEHAH